jgi:hypothetical protein
MNLRSCILATTFALAVLSLGPARAHDPNEEFDRLPQAAAARSAPTTCEELAAQGHSGYTEDDDTKALRLRCAEEKKAKAKPKAPAAPAKKT